MSAAGKQEEKQVKIQIKDVSFDYVDKKSRMAIPRHLRYTAAPTAADVNIKPAVCINIMPKRTLKETR